MLYQHDMSQVLQGKFIQNKNYLKNRSTLIYLQKIILKFSQEIADAVMVNSSVDCNLLLQVKQIPYFLGQE